MSGDVISVAKTWASSDTSIFDSVLYNGVIGVNRLVSQTLCVYTNLYKTHGPRFNVSSEILGRLEVIKDRLKLRVRNTIDCATGVTHTSSYIFPVQQMCTIYGLRLYYCNSLVKTF